MSNHKHPVCIVVPCYRIPLAAFETAALNRCISVLGKYPIFLIKPESLRIDDLLNAHPGIRADSFPDEFFDGITGYNRLLLSDRFYAHFDAYQYMLIHQLDAFVFSDQLLDWCVRGYDYIGAPWLPAKPPPTGLRKLHALFRQKLYRLIDKKNCDRSGAHHMQYTYCVGNGGFSLRRIATMRNTLKLLSRRAERYRNLAHHTYGEDIFFCVEANRYRNHVRTPDLFEALRFAWESQPALALRLCGGKFPFGCHGWDKLHRDEWQPIFASLGYSIDSMLDQQRLPCG